MLTLDARSRSRHRERIGKPLAEPTALELDFGHRIDRLFERLSNAALAQAKRKAGTRTSDAMSEDEKELADEFDGLLDLEHDEAEHLVFRVAAHNQRQLKQSLGVRVPELSRRRSQRLARAVVQTIRGFARELAAALAPAVSEVARKGARADALIGLIEKRLAVHRTRARDIAIGQVVRINSTVTRERHEALGVKEYIWHAVGGRSGDRYTRRWHAKLHGTRQRYDRPPRGGGGGPYDHGNPGSKDKCRCQALPVLPE